MRINKIEVMGFGKIKGLKTEFGRGFNLIYGKNESGKSTLQLFLKSMFFAPTPKRFKPWQDDVFGGAMEYRLDNGKSYRIERNFNNGLTQIYDENFNNITCSFEVSRNKGVLFGEKHLGVSEKTFEKTVFLKQMETQIGNDGVKELLDRLSNISRTGSEDISLLRAQEALKEALKNHVGTDKTVTRPLDKVNRRIDELKAEKKAILQGLERLTVVENDLNQVMKDIGELETRKTVILKAKAILSIKKKADELWHRYNQLNEGIGSVNRIDNEAEVLQNHLRDFKQEQDSLVSFMTFDEDEVEQVSSAYSKIQSFEDEKGRLLSELERKKEETYAVEFALDPLKGFNHIDNNTEKAMLNLKKDLHQLKVELLDKNAAVFKERLKGLEFLKWAVNSLLYLSLSIITASVLMNIKWFPFGFLLAPLPIAGAAFTIYKRIKIKKELVEVCEEQVKFLKISNQMTEKQNQLESILKLVGAEDLDEFMRLKALYDSHIQKVAILNGEIDNIEEKIYFCEDKINQLGQNITEKLIKAGIFSNVQEDISFAKINGLKQGMKQYHELTPKIKNIEQRLKELNDAREDIYLKLLPDVDTLERDKMKLMTAAREILESYDGMKNELEAAQMELRDQVHPSGMEWYGYQSRIEEITSMGCTKVEANLDKDYEQCCNDLTDLLLKAKEFDTVLKNTGPRSGDIQKIHEQLEELERTKERLEGIGFSLKTAFDILAEASREIQNDFAPVLNAKLSSVMNRISSGKYQHVKTDEQLTIKTIDADLGSVVPSSILSGGTVDQIYLALRIALADVINASGEKLPFIMDEVFAQYDDERMSETLKLFKEISAERQMFLFTCKEREVEIVQHIFGNDLNVIII